MKKFLCFLTLISFFLSAFPLGIVTGTFTADNTLDVTVRIPSRVGINLSGGDLVFDLGDASVTYPAAVFPSYYYPTNTGSPHIPLSVFCNVANGWNLTVLASADFDATLPVAQLYFADEGEALSTDGGAVGGTWTAFSLVSQVVVSDITRTTGWDAYNQDYQLQITGNESVLDPGATITITYTITSL